MEMFYSELNDVDQIIIKNILEQTEFDLENVQETAMFEKKMKDIFYYFIFTKSKKIWEPIRFAYDTKLEPIQLFDIRSKDFKIICLKGRRKLKHDEVAHILTQMIRNASLFFIPKQMEALSLKDAYLFLEREMVDENGKGWFSLDPKSQIVMKLLFVSGFLFEVRFQVDVVLHVDAILDLALDCAVSKENESITVSDLKTAAFTDAFIQGVRKIFQSDVKSVGGKQ